MGYVTENSGRKVSVGIRVIPGGLQDFCVKCWECWWFLKRDVGERKVDLVLASACPVGQPHLSSPFPEWKLWATA